MNDYGRVQPGDAVRYRLPDDSWLYGLVEAVHTPAAPAEQSPAAIVQVAFPVTDQSLAPVRTECDPALLLPLPDPELRAFLAANTGHHWARPQHTQAADNAMAELESASEGGS